MAYTYHPALIQYVCESSKTSIHSHKEEKPHKIHVLLNEYFNIYKGRTETLEYMCSRKTGLAVLEFIDSKIAHDLVKDKDIDSLSRLFDAVKDRNIAIVLQLLDANFSIEWIANALSYQRAYIEHLLVYHEDSKKDEFKSTYRIVRHEKDFIN
jgi:Mg/Co/Ni transporter MgtE